MLLIVFQSDSLFVRSWGAPRCVELKLPTSAGTETPQRNRKDWGKGWYFPIGRGKGQAVYPGNDGLEAYKAENKSKNVSWNTVGVYRRATGWRPSCSSSAREQDALGSPSQQSHTYTLCLYSGMTLAFHFLISNYFFNHSCSSRTQQNL